MVESNDQAAAESVLRAIQSHDRRVRRTRNLILNWPF